MMAVSKSSKYLYPARMYMYWSNFSPALGPDGTSYGKYGDYYGEYAEVPRGQAVYVWICQYAYKYDKDGNETVILGKWSKPKKVMSY